MRPTQLMHQVELRATYLHACLPAYLHACLPTYMSAYLPTCLPTCLPAYLPTYLPAYLPTCLRVCTSQPPLRSSPQGDQEVFGGLISPSRMATREVVTGMRGAARDVLTQAPLLSGP